MRKRIAELMIWLLVCIGLIIVAFQKGLFNDFIIVKQHGDERTVEQVHSTENVSYPYQYYSSFTLDDMNENILEDQIHPMKEYITGYATYYDMQEGIKKLQYCVESAEILYKADGYIDRSNLKKRYGKYLDDVNTFISDLAYLRIKVEMKRLSDEKIQESILGKDVVYIAGTMHWMELLGEEFKTKCYKDGLEYKGEIFLFANNINTYVINNDNQRGGAIGLKPGETCTFYNYYVVPREIAERDSMYVALDIYNNAVNNHLDFVQFIKLDLTMPEEVEE